MTDPLKQHLVQTLRMVDQEQQRARDEICDRLREQSDLYELNQLLQATVRLVNGLERLRDDDQADEQLADLLVRELWFTATTVKLGAPLMQQLLIERMLQCEDEPEDDA